MDDEIIKLSHIQVEKGVQALLQVIRKTEEAKEKNQSLLVDGHSVNLQFTTKKVSREKKTIKLKLPNGLGQQNKEVCLFVKDLDKTDREYEKSVRQFKTLLKSKGISCVSEIIPLKALKLEHKPFEAKRNLSNRFDVFLADARIIRLLPAYIGKAFFGRKRQPVQVRMDAKDLKEEFESAVNNSRCILSGKGSVGMATVGHTSMSVAELVQNITSSTEQIMAALPGGAENIRNFHIKTESSMAIPIYVSLGSANDIKLPRKIQHTEQVIAEEVTTVENALVKVYTRGVVKLVNESGKTLERPRKTVKRANKHVSKPSVSKTKRQSQAEDLKLKPTKRRKNLKKQSSS